MLNQKRGSAKTIRLLQALFLFIALWFIYWAHIYEMVTWNKTFLESLLEHLYPNVLIYSSLIMAIIILELYGKRNHHNSTEKLYTTGEVVLKKQKHGELLQTKKQIPSNKLGLTFVIVGALSLIYSFVVDSSILAFIGLGLTFWGALFLFARSTKFVRSNVLESSVVSFYAAFDRITNDLNYTGKPVYIPSYPKGTYLPEYLEGLKEMVIFISSKDSATMPAVEELAKKRFLVKNPEGMCFSPPGFGLLRLFENELRIDFTKIDRETLYDSLPTIIVNNLELAGNFEIVDEQELIHVKISGSVYSGLYSKEWNLNSVQSLGCPLVSAVICALAKTTGKRLTIAETKISQDLKTIDLWYHIVEG